jgi:hypothetical protein
MKCPVCKEVVENFREHALNHVRADEASAIETWDHLQGEATFVLHPLKGSLTLKRIRSLTQQLKPNQSLIRGQRLRQIERTQKTG